MTALRSKLWIISGLGILLIVALLALSLSQSRRAILAGAHRDLAAFAEDNAARLTQWRSNLSGSLIALAEQREIREGVARLNSGQANPSWREGFIAADAAACRVLMIALPGLENLAFRDLNGNKIAGTGAALDSLSYPDLRQRIRYQRLSPTKDKLIVPVRNAQAQPLAYVAAEVNLQASKKAIHGSEQLADILVCLSDSSGDRIWDSSDSLKIPRLDLADSDFMFPEGQAYLIANVSIPGTNWILSAARNREAILSDFSKARKRIAVEFGAGILLLGLVSLALTRRLY